MAHGTITRNDLFDAIDALPEDRVRDDVFDKLHEWAEGVHQFALGTWDKCPLDQTGFVKAFERRRRYDDRENTRFCVEAETVEAAILDKVRSDTFKSGPIFPGFVVEVV